jgi:hypothetical protein
MLKSRVDLQSAETLWSILSNSSSVRLVDVTKDLEQRALQLFSGTVTNTGASSTVQVSSSWKISAVGTPSDLITTSSKRAGSAGLN